MRRAALLVLVAAPAFAAASVTACAPIFGIVSRYYGPTWCEEDAQATTNGYCDDFDYVSTATMMQELPASLNGSLEITDAVANSPPNSLGLTSIAVSGNDGGVVVGHLVAFGPPTMSAGLPRFQCQGDLRPTELAAVSEAGVTVGVMGVGGQATGAKGAPGAPEITLLSFGPEDTVDLSLELLKSPSTPAERISSADACTSPHLARNLTGDWQTFELSFSPADLIEGGVPEGSCVLEAPAGDPKHADGGEPVKDGGVKDGGLKDGGVKDYVVLARLGPFFLQPARVPDPGFFGQPYFVYGLFIEGRATSIELHFDNVRCTLMPP